MSARFDQPSHDQTLVIEEDLAYLDGEEPRQLWAAVVVALSLHIMLFAVILNTPDYPIPLKLVQGKPSLLMSLEPDNQRRADKPDSAPEAAEEKTDEKPVDEPVQPTVTKTPRVVKTQKPVVKRPERNAPGPKPSESEAESALDALQAMVSTKALATNSSSTAAAYRARGVTGKRKALKRYGGSQATEEAVMAALRWLASVQDAENVYARDIGSWSPDRYAEHYLQRGTREMKRDYDLRVGGEGVGAASYRLGMTALCTLAFSGAGHTRERGQFKRTMTLALEYLLRSQDNEGAFVLKEGGSSHDVYDHSLTLLALADCFAIDGEESLKTPIQRGLDVLLRVQQPSGGWDYAIYGTRMNRKRSDLSITGFAVMALKACRAAGFDVPRQAWAKAISFLKWTTSSTGDAYYADADPGEKTKSRGLTAVNLFSRRMLGEAGKSPQQQRLQNLIMSTLPGTTSTDQRGFGVYQWYYSALALMLEDGDDWQLFNIAMKDTLLSTQNKSGHRKGSWDPDSHYGGRGGRVFETAMSCLCLEVYYRYIPEFLVSDSSSLTSLWED